MKRKLLALLAIFAGLGTATWAGIAAASADGYPSRTIKIVVPYSPGGSTDTLARLLAGNISQRLGQSVIVENRPGAGSNIGAAFVASSPPDGYTIFLGTSAALAVNVSLYKSLPYDPQRDFEPVILATTLPSVVVVKDAVPAKTLPELIAFLKSRPGKENYGSAGNGTPAHLGGEVFKRMTGVDVSHVPYKGGAPALADLAGGQTTYMIAILPEAMPLVKSGKIRALAVTTPGRVPAYPDLPTVAESGLAGYELIAWFAFAVPAKTPKEIVAKLNKAFEEALQDKEIGGKLADMGFIVEGGPPSRLGDLMRSEAIKWRAVVQEAGIKVD